VKLLLTAPVFLCLKNKRAVKSREVLHGPMSVKCYISAVDKPLLWNLPPPVVPRLGLHIVLFTYLSPNKPCI